MMAIFKGERSNRTKSGAYIGSCKPLAQCAPHSGYTVHQWANQHGAGKVARFTSSSIHARINRRVGLSPMGGAQ